MSRRITILGAGPGGHAAAMQAAEMGAEVTIVERYAVGGTCLNWGCIPTKIMKTTADLLDGLLRAPEFGVSIQGEARLDMARLMERKKKVIADQARGLENALAKRKVRLLKGEARILGPDRLAVSQVEGDLEVAWDSLVLAMGSRPAPLKGLDFDGHRIISSNEAVSLETLPRSMVIVGGGVIGCELASILHAMGVGVTLVEALDRLLPLPSIDDSCSRIVEREFKKRKLKFMTGRVVEKVEDGDAGLRVTIGPSPLVERQGKKAPGSEVIEVEYALVCVGRAPVSDRLGLDTLGDILDKRGWIKADEHLATPVPDVYAIGDALGPEKVMLAHAAQAEGLAAARNIMGGQESMNYDLVPGAVFTTPEVGCVGLSEAQARERGIDVRATTALFRQIGKAQAMGEIAGQAKIVSDMETGRIVGVHIVGPHATDLIAEGVLAVQYGLTTRDLAAAIHAHPTLAEILWEASGETPL